VILSAPSGASIADGAGVATIVNDDFTDPSVAGVPVKAIHLTELRAAINGTRAEKGLAPFAFSDSPPTVLATMVKAVHITEMRTALDQAYAASSQAPPEYTDQQIAGGITIKAVHLTELRAAVANLP
jgi:hypothetical protein